MNHHQDIRLSDARIAVLRALHALGGAGTAEAIRLRSKLSPASLSDALQTLVADDWVQYEHVSGFGVWRLTPQRRRQAALREADHAQ